ncbi:MAG: hypothetical protein V9E83_11645 [Baekduia sp.]
MRPDSRVDLLWIPLGAGGRFVARNGRIYEAVAARRRRRRPADLYHSALEVQVDGDRYAIEQGPVWNLKQTDRGVVAVGPVGSPALRRFSAFRYEVRCWRGGVIPDRDAAVESPQRVSSDAGAARRVIELAPEFPTATWGRDEQRTGEMWNSNSLVSWLLTRSGHDIAAIGPPAGGRAPGWSAGIVVAGRSGGARASS